MLRKTLVLCSLITLACTSTRVPTPGTTGGSPPTGPSKDKAVNEARLLQLEDRREYDREVLTAWASDPSPERRRRAAIAIARIGAATFEDLDGDGWQGDNEPRAGSPILLTLTVDPEPTVREAAAFAFGETGDLRGVEALFALTRDDDAAVATRAAEALAKLVPDVPFDRYETLLAPEASPAVRAVAIRYLFRFGTDRASGSAALLLDSTDPQLRREAAYSLSRHAIPQSRRRVEALLSEPDVLTRAYAARALGRIASPSSVSALLEAANEPHAWVRTNALRALGDILDRSDGEVTETQAAEIANVAVGLTGDPDTGTAASAIELTGRIGTRVPAARSRLVEIAASGSAWHREIATLWLVRTYGVESVATVQLPDSPWIRIRILEGTSAADSGGEIRGRYFADGNPSVRAAAIANIPEQLTAEDRTLIRAALADTDPVVRASALGRVSDAFPDEAAMLLREAEIAARSDRMNDARLAAIEALAAISSPSREGWLNELVRDSDPVVRRVAADHLTTVTGRRPQYTPLPVDRPIAEYAEIAAWASRPHIASLELPRGEIRIALRADEAPMTSWNFASLASSGYFDGTSFMRVVPNFVIQGGDPRNDMSGGPGYAIRDEINMLRYSRGAVGMALSGPDTGGSQFFVTHSPQPHLDGGYTVFGHVISGRGTILEQVERGDPVSKVSIREGSWTQLEIDKVAGVPLPTIIGEVSVDDLMQIVPEYPERRAGYAPDPDVVSYMASLVQPDDHVIVVLGSWCHDSQREVPRFIRVVDELRAFGVELPVRYLAVSREKDEPAELIDGLGIELVATFIYYRNGVEIGRIVETAEGPFEDHLLRIVAGQ